MRVLFVCLGNICRSPLAEGIARTYYKEHIFDSAGTGAWHVGQPPCMRSQIIAKKKGIDISTLKARQVSVDDIGAWDKVVAMDSKNLADLKAMGFENAQMLLDTDVPDPYYFDNDEKMDEIYEMIKGGIDRLLA
ncbi:MAG: low molecular weight phosphotyrosine protein phosphatase [Epsilonproteobacteria bacterium]|nr:low molecular weight phosphotyrosine protein phosphatase [Campylobacterota bacterium]